MKVLIADDSKTSLLTLKHVLVKLGHEVVSTLDVHSILELYTNENPDLIILDVVMDEEVDGFQIAKEIRAIEKNWIPIIFLSARVDDEYIKKGVDAGGDDYLLKPCSDITISAKIKAMQRISHMRSKLVDISDKLKTLSSYDPLTQAPNRMLFESKFISSISRAKRNNSFMALLFIDLDNFKYVNDTLGHDVGDDLLKYVTTSFTSILRECDTLHNPGTIKPIDLDDPKFLARMGGDEFAIIIDEVNDYKDAAIVAERLIACLEKTIIIKDKHVNVGCSIGIACYPHAGEDIISLEKSADIAMYKAKDCGKNNFQFYSEELNKSYNYNFLLINELKSALGKNEIYLMFQNIYNITNGKEIGKEVYTRWNNHQLGEVGCEEFITAAESANVIMELGEFILNDAAEKFQSWHDQKINPGQCHINISTKQLRSKYFIDGIIKTTQAPEYKDLNMCLDISQKTLNDDFEAIKDHLHMLHDNNIKLYLDDFGLPSACLRQIASSPFTGVKINYNSLNDTMKEKEMIDFIKGIISATRSMNLILIVKHVETKEVEDFLKDLGVEFAQGFLYHKPERASDINQKNNL